MFYTTTESKKKKKKSKDKCTLHKSIHPCSYCNLLNEIERRRREGEIV